MSAITSLVVLAKACSFDNIVISSDIDNIVVACPHCERTLLAMYHTSIKVWDIVDLFYNEYDEECNPCGCDDHRHHFETKVLPAEWAHWHLASGCPTDVTPRRWVSLGHYNCPCPPDRAADQWRYECIDIEEAYASNTFREAAEVAVLHYPCCMGMNGVHYSLDIQEGRTVVIHTTRAWDNDRTWLPERAAQFEAALVKAEKELRSRVRLFTSIDQLKGWLCSKSIIEDEWGVDNILSLLSARQRWNIFGERNPKAVISC